MLRDTLVAQIKAKREFDAKPKEPKMGTGERANKIELSFCNAPEDGQEKFSYLESSKHTNGIIETYNGEVKDAAHKQALIDRARENAQERECWLTVREGWHTTINENYRS